MISWTSKAIIEYIQKFFGRDKLDTQSHNRVYLKALFNIISWASKPLSSEFKKFFGRDMLDSQSHNRVYLKAFLT